jgi:lipopolysaccharide export system protein LptC
VVTPAEPATPVSSAAGSSGAAGAALRFLGNVELHLPDLPEVPISLGALARPAGVPRQRMPWYLRLREVVSAYLPVLLMALLALASWWLVKNSPRAPAAAEERLIRSDPDYTLSQFAVERFDAQGRLKLRIEGARLKHFPASDRFEVDDAVIRAISAEGRVMLAQARRALGSGDGSELQLLGDAQVISNDAGGAAVVMRSDFLHLFVVAERVTSHLPVFVSQGANEMNAAGLDYDHGARRLELKGPMRAQLPARGVPAAARAATRAAP